MSRLSVDASSIMTPLQSTIGPWVSLIVFKIYFHSMKFPIPCHLKWLAVYVLWVNLVTLPWWSYIFSFIVILYNLFQGWLLKRSSNENLYLVPLFDAIYNDAEQFVFLNTEAKMEVLSCNKIRQVYFCSSVIDLFMEVVIYWLIYRGSDGASDRPSNRAFKWDGDRAHYIAIDGVS